MRPWLALKWGGVAFEERITPLGGEGYGRSQIKEIRAISPSGRVPALHVDGAIICESLSTNIRRRLNSAPKWPSDTRADIERLEAIWSDLLNRFGGPFLFSQRSIADAMFAPVATRLRTYAVEISPQAQSYCDTLFADAAFRDWERAAEAETWTIEQTEALHR